MKTTMFRNLLAAGLLSVVGSVLAQPAPAGAPSSPAIGQRNAPSDGAIQGGSIGPAPGQPGVPKAQPRNRELERCYELSGTLRQQCLQQNENASGGATSSPGLPPEAPRAGPGGPDRGSAPPPQNPQH